MTTTSTPVPAVQDMSFESGAAPATPSWPTARRFIALFVPVLLLVVGSAAWASSSPSGAPADRAPVQIVEDGRWGGPDVFEPRVPDGPRFGSADALERQSG